MNWPIKYNERLLASVARTCSSFKHTCEEIRQFNSTNGQTIIRESFGRLFCASNAHGRNSKYYNTAALVRLALVVEFQTAKRPMRDQRTIGVNRSQAVKRADEVNGNLVR